MAKKAAVKTSSELLGNYLTKHKEDHLNFEEEIDWKVSTGSLQFDICLNGGWGPGAYKVHGASFNGKSSQTAQCMRNFLKTVENSKGLWVKSEGRLDKEFQERSGVKFVFKAEDWKVGTCFVYESNIFESVTDLVNELVKNNPEKNRYCMVVDSMDNLIRRDDMKKESSESEKVGAAGLLTSTMFKRVNLVLNKLGHSLFFINQVRSKIRGQYDPQDPNEKVGGGGPNAVVHNANQAWQFLPRLANSNIEEDGEIVGHYCRIKLTKGVKERTDIIVEYPIRHGAKNGDSIWRERELADLLVEWDLVKKAGAWISPSEELKIILQDCCEVSDDLKWQGMNNLFKWVSDDKKISDFLYNYFLNEALQS